MDTYQEELASYAGTKNYIKKHPILRYLFLELTKQCNLRCLHCGSRCPSFTGETLVEKEKLFEVIDEVSEHVKPSQMMFCITGGEPLLRRDWYEICSYITEKGYAWGMTSNGTLIDRECAERLRKSGMNTISISLDGMKESHERLRNVPGCFEKAVQGLRCLIACGGFECVQVTTVVNRYNISELEEMYNFLRELGVDSWKVTAVEPIGNARENSELLLKPQEYRRMFDFILEKRQQRELDVTFGCSHFLPEKYDATVRRGHFLCGAGTAIASISSEGDILACLDIEDRARTRQGNVRDDSFWEVWKNGFGMFRENHWQCSDFCKDCRDAAFCQGESWHTWNFETNEPDVCMHKRPEIYAEGIGGEVHEDQDR